MKLDRLILVSWGQIAPGDYDMGDMTLLTGETGSGKSTMLDGLQTVMTAAYNGILNYNPGQDEVTQGQRRGKTKRSVESYVVGAEYSKFSRPDGAQGYVAAVFRPDEGEANATLFTAVIAISARVEGQGEKRQAKLEAFIPFIVDNAALTYSDFMVDPEKGVTISTEQIVRKLKAAHPRIHEFHDRKRDYLSALYGRFRGKNGVTWDEASQAARAWVQSIAYRPIGSVHELVRDEILDFDGKQLLEDVERISGLMRQVANLREEGRRLQKSVNTLDALSVMLGETAQAHEKHVQQELLVARLQKHLDDQRIETCNQDALTATKEVGVLNERIQRREHRAHALDDRKAQLKAQLLGVPAAQQKDNLDRQLATSTQDAKRALKGLCGALMAASLLDNRATTAVAQPCPPGVPAIEVALQKVARARAATQVEHLARHQPLLFSLTESPAPDAEQLLTLAGAFGDSCNEGLSPLYEALVGAGEGSLLTAVTQEMVRIEQREETTVSAVRDLVAKNAKLSKGGVSYPPGVELAVSRIREMHPEANALVLCDLVDPVSEAWQPAVEGYMGGARFNLIVDPDWERRIIDLAQANNWRVNIIQGSKCLRDAERRALPSDSIVHELRTANPIARAYLVDQFGSVVKVSDSETLRDTSRGVTKDGKGAGSRTMYLAEAKELVFGQKARARQLEQVQAQLQDAEREAARVSELKAGVKRLQGCLAGIKEPRFEASSLADFALSIQSAQRALAMLDLSETKDLDSQLIAVAEELEQLKAETKKDEQAVFGLNAKVAAAQREAKAIEALKPERLSSLERQIARVKALCEVNAYLSYSNIAKAIDTQLAAGVTLEDARAKLDTLSRKPPVLLGQAREALGEFHRVCREDERFLEALPQQHLGASFDQDYPQVEALLQAVEQRLQALRSIGLYHNKAELEAAVASFNDVFTKNFCAEIKTKVDDGIRTLRQMNNELKSLKFGSDRFSIDWSKWEPEFEEYLDFFNAVYRMTESADTLDLFGENTLSDAHIAVRDRLVKLLLDDDQASATRELMRIADYRNYRRYDIFNESDSGGRIRLSEWGTGSGGQLETPAYIVRAAVVTNRLKLFEKGPSLKLLVNDESFAKMDETRARAVLSFLRDNLNLQVISAMPTMKAGSLKDEFSREYSFTRLTPVANGELDFMSDVDERVFKSDKMRELWARQRAIAQERAKQLFEETEEAPSSTAAVAETVPSQS